MLLISNIFGSVIVIYVINLFINLFGKDCFLLGNIRCDDKYVRYYDNVSVKSSN